MNYGLNQTTIEKIRAVLRRYPQVEQAVLYGSRAKETAKTGSDIDLTLCGGSDLTLRVLYRIMDDLDDLLLPYTFDLSIFNHIDNPDLLDHIRRIGITVYRQDAISELL
jgi:uncharacterized protein